MRERETELGSASLGGDDAGPLINLGCFFFFFENHQLGSCYLLLNLGLNWATNLRSWHNNISQFQPKHGVPVLFLIGNGRL
jgi:hypothetical protein